MGREMTSATAKGARGKLVSGRAGRLLAAVVMDESRRCVVLLHTCCPLYTTHDFALEHRYCCFGFSGLTRSL